LDRWIDLTRRPLTQFLHDFAAWEELRKFIRHPNAGWASANLHRNFPNYGAQVVWVLRVDGAMLHASSVLAGPPLAPPVSRERLNQTGLQQFFAESRDGLLEVQAVRAGQELHLLQIAREAVSNALRHGQASGVALILRPGEGASIIYEVQDNGSGFDPARIRQGSGLANIAARAKEMHAEFALHSSPEKELASFYGFLQHLSDDRHRPDQPCHRR
jgi:hypothetical protein